MINPTQRPLPDNSTQSQEKDLHILGGIRTRSLSKWTAKNRELDGVATVIGKHTCILISIIWRQNPRQLPLLQKHSNFISFYDYLWIKFCVFTEVDWEVLFLQCDVVWFGRNWRTFLGKVPSQFNDFPVRCDLFGLLHYCRQLYVFRVLTPIIRSWYSCNYSFWYWLTAIISQQDATYSVYYISVDRSTCFRCWHPSSAARTAVITAFGID